MRTTLLKHTLTDGSWHVDWLVEVEPGDAPCVPTFRLRDRPDRSGVVAFDAEQLPDHRRLYLDYTGEVSGGRGWVEPLASGAVIRAVGWPARLDVWVKLGGKLWRWQGLPGTGAAWRFRAVAT